MHCSCRVMGVSTLPMFHSTYTIIRQGTVCTCSLSDILNIPQNVSVWCGIPIYRGSQLHMTIVPQTHCAQGLKCHKMPQKHTFLIVFFVYKYLASATLTLTKCHMWHLCRQLRRPAIDDAKCEFAQQCAHAPWQYPSCIML